MGLGMAVVSTVHEQEELVSFLEHFTKEDSSIQGGEVPFYIGLTRQQGFFTIISSRTQRSPIYHEDYEKRGILLGGCGVVAYERNESRVSQ